MTPQNKEKQSDSVDVAYKEKCLVHYLKSEAPIARAYPSPAVILEKYCAVARRLKPPPHWVHCGRLLNEGHQP
jgi:hypothetical protein